MKRFLKKLAVVVIAIMCCATMFTVVGCGKNEAKYKIGVLLYNYTDIQGKQIKEYGDYLSKEFGVEFKYESVGSDDDSHIKGLEACLNQGCDAIFSGYNTAIDKCIEKCEEAGVYYGLLLGDTATTQIAEKNLKSKYYLGGVKQFSADPGQAGIIFADIINKSSYTNIAGVSFPPFAFIDGTTLWNKMVEELNDSKVIVNAGNEPMPFPFNYKGDYYYFMFTQDLCQAEIDKMFTANPNIEVVVGMGSGMDYVLPALRSSGKTNVKMLALGYSDDVESYLKDGTLLAAGTNNYVQSMASLFARAYDAMESDGSAWYSDRAAATSEFYQYGGVDGAADYTILTSVEEVKDFKNYVIGNKANGPITSAELKECMLSFNENATWDSLTKLTTRNLAAIKAVRA